MRQQAGPSSSPEQLLLHPNPVVARQAGLALHKWAALPGDEVPPADDLRPGMPLPLVLDGLTVACMQVGT